MNNPNQTQQTHYNELREMGVQFNEYGIYSLTVGQYAILYKYAVQYRYLRSCRNHFTKVRDRFSNVEYRAEWYYNLLMVKADRYNWEELKEITETEFKTT